MYIWNRCVLPFRILPPSIFSLMKRIAIALLIVVGCISMAHSQTAPAPTPPCSSPEFRQFDFWIGEWEVYVGDKLAGTNRIDRILDGCVLMENWVGSRGGRGHSFNVYDQTTGKWEQTWVDNSGINAHFYGSYADGKMALEGKGIGPKGEPALTKLTFWNNADGTVRQLWEQSLDEGKTWTVLFDGLYRKKKAGN